MPRHASFNLIEAEVFAIGQTQFADQPVVRFFLPTIQIHRLSEHKMGEVLLGASPKSLVVLGRIDAFKSNVVLNVSRKEDGDGITIGYADDLSS